MFDLRSIRLTVRLTTDTEAGGFMQAGLQSISRTPMTLVPGARLGPYEILGPIGAGGMGEVYRARDPRLERDVAIKVLPADRMADASRRARFAREARAASALNHPNIVTVHEIGSADGLDFIVMEYVAGRTLGQLLLRGRLALAEALRLAVPMAGALARAHASGIVHRDLKPSNVAVSEEGVVKILDFGLAKLVDPRKRSETPGVETQETETAAPVGTGPGLVAGTAGYMSPEQMSGGKVDARSDVFALGAVFYEMVTGHRAFPGGSTAEILMAVLQDQPRPLAELVPEVPQPLERLIRRCLRKEPERRPQHMADVAVELEDIRDELGCGGTVQSAVGSGGSLPAAGARARRAVPIVGAAAIVGALGVLAGRTVLAPDAPPSLAFRTLLPIAPAEEVSSAGTAPLVVLTPGGSRTAIDWTPDGRALVFVGRVGNVRRLYVRPLVADQARLLSGTEGVIAFTISPDGRSVAFWAAEEIRRVAIAGGPVSVLVEDVPRSPSSLAWGEDGRLVYDRSIGDLNLTLWTAEPGRSPAPLTTLREGERSHTLPHLLPGGRVVVYTARRSQSTWGGERVVAQVLATGERKVLVENATDARYAAPGYLLFMRRGTLCVVRFDADRLEVRGEPEPVLDTVAQALTAGNLSDITGAGHFALAPNGTLAYLRAPVTPYPETELVSIDRRGHVSPLLAAARSYRQPRLSPSGRSMVVSIRSPDGDGLWLYDLQRGTLTRLGEGLLPRWTPDGERIAFFEERGGTRLSWQRADGTTPAEVLVPGGGFPSSWTPDGRHLAFVRNGDIWVAPIEHAEAAAPLWESDDFEGWPEFAPDGRWLAYVSNATGRDEVYVQPYPGPGPRRIVSLEGGTSPAWRPDGHELFFLSYPSLEEWSMMAVEVRTGQAPRFSQPRRLFTHDPRILPLICSPVRCFDVALDGQGFYGTRYRPRSPSPPVTHINLIQNWMAELTGGNEPRPR